LPPYVSTTAVGLLALQDQRQHEAVRKSLQLLQQEWATEASGLALGLAAIALRRFGVSNEGVIASLQTSTATILALGNNHVVSVALFALEPEHNAFAY
jgi:hypothetical protein